MNPNVSKWGVLAAGIVTSIATAFIVTLINTITGFNVFTFSMWVLLPLGAIACGFAAASGYYFAARFLHLQPSRWLLAQMVVVAALTQMLIYWLEYKALNIDGVNVSSVIPFFQYLDVSLTSAHMRIGRGMHDTGQVGSFGYWLAAIDFVGFMIGGGFVYIVLDSTPVCADCKKYYTKLAVKKDSFSDQEEFAGYYDGVYTHPVDSEEFAAHTSGEYSAGKAQQGTINLESKLMSCPSCSQQRLDEKVSVFNGKEWKDINSLTRRTRMPIGLDLRGIFSRL
jgi:hypothetical protein